MKTSQFSAALKKPVQLAIAATLVATSVAAHGADGLIATKSNFTAKETMDRFESIAKEKGMKIFSRVNHTAGAKKVGKELRPTELLVFGNPKGGTPLMLCSQSFAIDLPLKALAWEDDKGQVWLGVNDLSALAARHKASDCPAVPKVKAALNKLVGAALK